jgi:hypothetical protein
MRWQNRDQTITETRSLRCVFHQRCNSDTLLNHQPCQTQLSVGLMFIFHKIGGESIHNLVVKHCAQLGNSELSRYCSRNIVFVQETSRQQSELSSRQHPAWLGKRGYLCFVTVASCTRD